MIKLSEFQFLLLESFSKIFFFKVFQNLFQNGTHEFLYFFIEGELRNYLFLYISSWFVNRLRISLVDLTEKLFRVNLIKNLLSKKSLFNSIFFSINLINNLLAELRISFGCWWSVNDCVVEVNRSPFKILGNLIWCFCSLFDHFLVLISSGPHFRYFSCVSFCNFLSHSFQIVLSFWNFIA